MKRARVLLFAGWAAAAFAFAVAAPETPQAEPDACSDMMPAPLLEGIPRAFPGYRLIRVADYSPDVVKAEKKAHKGECLGAIAANFDGQNGKDFAFLLVAAGRPAVVAVARSTEDGAWTFEQLLDLGQDAPGRNSVRIVPPGRYEDGRPDPPRDKSGWVQNYTSAFPGVGVGHFASPGVGVFYYGDHWVHLRLPH